MRNKQLSIRLLIALSGLVLTIGILVSACKKTGITIPPAEATFLNQSSGVFFVAVPNAVDSIPVGVTSVAKTDRTISFTVSSPSGAASPAQYTITSGNTVTIPANQAIGYIVVKGNFAAYDNTSRVDTLVVTFSNDKSAAVPASSFNSSFTLQLRGACSESDVNLADLAGTYANTFDDGQSGPYITTVTVGTTTGTTGTITISNFYNAGFGDLNFTLDWTNPNNRTVTFVPQSTGTDAGGVFGPAYAGNICWLYTTNPPSTGTFSVCKQTILVNYRIALFPLGAAAAAEQTILSR